MWSRLSARYAPRLSIWEWLKRVNMMRPQQLMISLANIGCDIEWVLGSRESSVEEQVKGVPNNCMKWLDYTVTKNLDGDEVLLSLKKKNHF